MSTATLVPELPTPAPVIIPQTNSTNIWDAALMLTLIRRWPPQSKAINNKAIVTSTASPAMLSVNKKLFDCPELRAILNKHVHLDIFLKKHSSPMPLQTGHHIVPNDLYHQVEARIKQTEAEVKDLIAAFKASYQTTLDHSKEILGDQFDPSDYPSIDRIDKMFVFKWNYIDFSVANKLTEIDKETAERKYAEMEQDILDAKEVNRGLLRVEMQELMNELVSKLSSKADAKTGELKRKTFRETVLDKIQEFHQLFDARDLSKDGKLKDLVMKTQQLLNGVAPDKLRSDDNLRNSVRDGFTEIKKNLDQILVDEPIRTIRWE